MLLHLLKKPALFLPNVCGEHLCKLPQLGTIEGARLRPLKIFAKPYMLGEQFLHDRRQIRLLPRQRKHVFLFRREVVLNLEGEMLLDLLLPRLHLANGR